MSRKKHARSRNQKPSVSGSASEAKHRILEIVLKGDVYGTVEAVRSSISYIQVPGVELRVIQAGVGAVSKSDLMMAQTGSRLVIGFNVGVGPKLEKQAMESGIEIRLYDVIYKLSKDLTRICRQLCAEEPREKITGSGKVIATFKAGKGMIIGCEVTEGTIERNRAFRVITSMGPAYFGRVESLQIENKAAKLGRVGQQVGIHIPDWEKARVGDLVECYETVQSKNTGWRPTPGIFRL